MSFEAKKPSVMRWFLVSFARGLAAFFALYSLFSIGAVLINGAYNQNAWWIDFGFLPEPFPVLEQLALTLALAFFACHIPKQVLTRLIVSIPVIICFIAAAKNTADVYTAAATGAIILGFPLPFSVFVGFAVLWILMGILFGYTLMPEEDQAHAAKPGLAMTGTFFLAMLLFPLGQMHCFGTTEYRVPVDAAVVLGAQVYPDGTPSRVLQDRLDTAIQFYKDGYAPVLVMSGGIDIDGTSEAEVMRSYAVEQGLNAEDIIIDEYGSNTKQTAQNTVAMLQAAGMSKVATVSNFYHLSRIKMLYLAQGMDVVTVPSVPHKDPTYPLSNVLREIPGWWYYWLLNLVE